MSSDCPPRRRTQRQKFGFTLIASLLLIPILPAFSIDFDADLALQVAEGVRGVPLGDLNGDGMTDDLDLFYLALHWRRPVTQLNASSPVNGEADVAISRETILRFSDPLDPSTVGSDSILAVFGGIVLGTRLHTSPDGKTVTIFYDDPLPPSARVRVSVDGNKLKDERGLVVEADRDGVPGGVETIDFDTLTLTTLPGTAVCGRVFASELASAKGASDPLNIPLEGVRISVDGMADTLFAITDAFGNFRLEPAPVGKFFVHIDGRTVSEALIGGVTITTSYPNGHYYPYVGKAWDSIAGLETNVGNVFLPLVLPGTLQPVSQTQDTEVGFVPEILADHPEFEGVAATIPSDSLYADDGTRGGMVGIAPVPPDRIPGQLPPGLEFPIVITVQTDGATNFDVPVPVCFPNLPDPVSGLTLPPGARDFLYSFNHDTGEFEVVGLMTVSQDGTLVCSDPGFGILAPGWHGNGPRPYTSTPCSSLCCNEEKGQPMTDDPPMEDCPATPENCEECLANCERGRIRCLENFSKWYKAHVKRCEAQCKETTATREQYLDCAYGDCLGLIRDQATSRRTSCFLFEEKCIDRCPCVKGVVEDQGKGVDPEGTEEMVSLLIEEFFDLLVPFQNEEEVPLEILEQAFGLLEEADLLAGGDAEAFLEESIVALEQEIIPGPEAIGDNPPYPIPYAAEILRPSEVLQLRGETDSFAQYELFAPRDGELQYLSFYDPRTKTLGYTAPNLWEGPGTKGLGVIVPGGNFFDRRLILPRFSLFPLDETEPDSDQDGLPNVVEQVYGTDPRDPDSDGDGVPDGAEVDQGTNPLDGINLRTGIIATADTPGNAVDICANNQLVVVADSEWGVSVFNIYNGMNPTIVAQVDTPGTAQSVGCSGTTVVVADGPEGLAVIDVSDPPNAEIIDQIGFGSSATAVTISGDYAFVGLSSDEIAVVDLAAGTEVNRVAVAGGVHDLSVDGETLFVLSDTELLSYSFEVGVLLFIESGATSNFSADGFTGRKRLFLGGGLAYASCSRGYDIFDIRTPTVIRRVGSAQTGGPVSFKQIVANGSGLGVAAVGVNTGGDGMHDVWLYDLPDETVTDAFLNLFETPGAARAAAIYNGLAYVADSESGMQVVNYLAFDTLGLAPALSLSTNFAPGLAESGEAVRVIASATDDVQVRNVEFYIDGVRVATDGAFPFEANVIAPSLIDQPTFTLRARVFDTGGNSTWTDEQVIVLVEDARPPRVRRTVPRNDGILFPDPEIAAFVSEALNPGSVNQATFALTWLGADEIADTTDDAAVAGTVSYRSQDMACVFVPSGMLQPGHYQAAIGPPIADLAGNELQHDVIWTFEVPRPLSYGETILASISELGEEDPYTFQAQEGEKVRMRMSEGGFLEPVLKLIDSGGIEIAALSSSGDSILEVTLESGGSFLFLGSDEDDDETGDYGVALQRLNVPVGPVELVYGQTLSASIEAVSEMDAYRFQGTAGEIVRIRMSEGGFLEPRIELFDDQGQPVGAMESGGDTILDVTLAVAGTYYLLLSDVDGDETGDYGVTVERLNPPVDFVDIVYGQTLNASLEAVSEIDLYRFQGSAGEIVRIRMSEGGFLEPRIELFDDQGRPAVSMDSGGDTILDVTLAATGTYYLLLSDVDGEETGDYGLTLQRLNPPVDFVEIVYGQTLNAVLGEVSELDVYRFQGSAGDSVRIRMNEDGFLEPRIELFDAQGHLLGVQESGGDTILETTLETTGVYYFILSDADGDETGDYMVGLQKLNKGAAPGPYSKK